MNECGDFGSFELEGFVSRLRQKVFGEPTELRLAFSLIDNFGWRRLADPFQISSSNKSGIGTTCDGTGQLRAE